MTALRPPQLLFWTAAAFLTAVGLHVWITHAPQSFIPGHADQVRHAGHLGARWWHIAFASPALLLGPFALWSGFRRRYLTAHRWTGRIYLAGGALGILGGMYLAAFAQHRPNWNFAAGLLVLGVAWLAAAAMAYRAIRNRRVESHREWMIRSYILTWSFVVCRLPEYPWIAPLTRALGPGAEVTVLWLGWTVPLMVAQLAMEWSRGVRATSSANRGGR